MPEDNYSNSQLKRPLLLNMDSSISQQDVQDKEGNVIPPDDVIVDNMQSMDSCIESNRGTPYELCGELVSFQFNSQFSSTSTWEEPPVGCMFMWQNSSELCER